PRPCQRDPHLRGCPRPSDGEDFALGITRPGRADVPHLLVPHACIRLPGRHHGQVQPAAGEGPELPRPACGGAAADVGVDVGVRPRSRLQPPLPVLYSWFLLSMAWWMITVPFIERFPRTMLVASLGMGLFGGVLPILDTELSAARTMAFWPFFVIGKLYGKQIIDWAGSLAIWQKLGLSFAALATVGYFYVDQVDHHWLYGSLNFAHFHVSIPEGVGLRLIMDIAAVLMTLALLSWLTDRNGLIATIGKHSLAIYVLHGFVVRGLQPVLDGSRDVLPDAIVFLICLALAVVWTG